MFNKEYYDEKKKVLEVRLNTKKDNLISKVMSSVNEFVQEKDEIVVDYQEIAKRETEEKQKEEAKKTGNVEPQKAEEKVKAPSKK